MSALRSAAVLLVVLGLAPGPPARAAARGDGTRVAALEVHGFRFRAGREQPARWQGAGVWIAPDLLVTAASVVLRARSIVAHGADGRAYRLDRVVLYDRQRDLAFVSGPAGPAVPPLAFRERPLDPRTLQGTSVVTLGAGEARGHVGGVAMIRGQEWIVHDAQVAAGASGGALIAEDGTLLGVNVAAGGAAGRAFAIPAWTIGRLHPSADGPSGIALGTLFAADSVALLPLAGPGADAGSIAVREVCAPSGGTGSLELPATGPGDVALEITPERGARVLVRVALDGEAPLAAGLFGEQRVVLQSIERDRAVVKVLVSSPQGTNAGPACAMVRPHAVDWAARAPRADLW